LHTVEIGIVRDISRALLFELKKLVLAVGVGLLLLLLSLIPGVGTLAATVGGIALAALLVCLDFLDAPLERRRLHFREKLGIVFRSLPASASFSLVCLGLVSIPLLNLLTIPLCVASGTLFFCDRIWPNLPNPPSLNGASGE
jgi:CysZ protein